MKSKIREAILPRVSEIAALFLWESGAVKVNLKEPFKLVSGNYSPIYINCRIIISHPHFMNLFTAFTQTLCRYHRIAMKVVAGGETAGIPFAAFVAQSLSLPLVYVRKAPKEHGITSRVEGNIPRAAKVLLVEDLITDAGSKLSFIEAIKDAGGIVEDVLVLFDREQGGREMLQNQAINLYSITDMATAINVAKRTKLLSKPQLESVQEYLHSPREWHARRNLPFVD